MNKLDLSAYPHIVRASEIEDKDELEKRSKALSSLRAQMENLVSSMDSYIHDLIQFDEKTRLLNQREYELSEQENAFSQKEQALYAREDEIKREKDYIINANIELKGRETDLLLNRDLIEQIRIEKEEWEDRKSEAIRAETALDVKLKNKKELDMLSKQLDERDSVITKKEMIDKERKRLLDLREDRILAREKRLHLDQSE